MRRPSFLPLSAGTIASREGLPQDGFAAFKQFLSRFPNGTSIGNTGILSCTYPTGLSTWYTKYIVNDGCISLASGTVVSGYWDRFRLPLIINSQIKSITCTPRGFIPGSEAWGTNCTWSVEISASMYLETPSTRMIYLVCDPINPSSESATFRLTFGYRDQNGIFHDELIQTVSQYTTVRYFPPGQAITSTPTYCRFLAGENSRMIWGMICDFTIESDDIIFDLSIPPFHG